MTIERDEVTFSEYLAACKGLERCAQHLRTASPDEVVQHYLPEIAQHTAIIFSFVGSNMTAREVPKYLRAQAELEAAKSGVDLTKANHQEEQ